MDLDQLQPRLEEFALDSRLGILLPGALAALVVVSAFTPAG